jgi:hypothetical protein
MVYKAAFFAGGPGGPPPPVGSARGEAHSQYQPQLGKQEREGRNLLGDDGQALGSLPLCYNWGHR